MAWFVKVSYKRDRDQRNHALPFRTFRSDTKKTMQEPVTQTYVAHGICCHRFDLHSFYIPSNRSDRHRTEAQLAPKYGATLRTMCIVWFGVAQILSAQLHQLTRGQPPNARRESSHSLFPKSCAKFIW